jgi:hypothetical protein
MPESSGMAISCLPSSALVMRIEYGWPTEYFFPLFHLTSYSLIWEFPLLFTQHPCYPFDDLTCQCVVSCQCSIYHSCHPLLLTSPLNNNYMISIMITKKVFPCVCLHPHPWHHPWQLRLLTLISCY